jgi:hypothetical protein
MKTISELVMSRIKSLSRRNATLFLMSNAAVMLSGIFSIGVTTDPTYATTLPSYTAIPVTFTHTIEAGKAMPGDTVTVKTIQIVVLPGGQTIPKGATVVGHVVESRPFVFDHREYAIQQPSAISIHFDRLVEKNRTTPVGLSVRALADSIESYKASVPQYQDETDSVGVRVLIGGDHFSPLAKEVLSRDEDIVGYNRKQGVFARLISSESIDRYASLGCGATSTEQSLAIFSADACGLYGFDGVYLQNCGKNDGTFRLESRKHTVQLHAGSTALLQILRPSQELAETEAETH